MMKYLAYAMVVCMIVEQSLGMKVDPWMVAVWALMTFMTEVMRENWEETTKKAIQAMREIGKEFDEIFDQIKLKQKS